MSATDNTRLFFVVLFALACLAISSKDPVPEDTSSGEPQSVLVRPYKYCAKFSKWPKNVDKSNKVQALPMDKLGTECPTKDDRQGRWMYNENGEWDCLQCCEDHTWNGTECAQCPPGFGTSQGVFENNCQEKGNLPDNGNRGSVNPTDKSLSADNDQGHQSPGKSPKTGEVEISDCSPGEVKVGNVTSNSADVAWDQFYKDCDGVHGIEIAIHINTAETAMLMTNRIVDPSEARYSLTNLQPNKSYCLELRASNPLKYGPWSKPVRFQTMNILTEEANSPGYSIARNVLKVTNETDLLLDLNVGENIINVLASNNGKYKLSVTFLGDASNGTDARGNNCTTECKSDVSSCVGSVTFWIALIALIAFIAFIVINNLIGTMCFCPRCRVPSAKIESKSDQEQNLIHSGEAPNSSSVDHLDSVSC